MASHAVKYAIEKRRDDVMRMLNMGWNTEKIAAQCGISVGTVNFDIKARLEDYAKKDDNTGNYRKSEGREMQNEIAQIKDMAFGEDGLNLKAAALLLRFRERYHKLFGLDIAVKQIIQHRHQDDDREIDDGIVMQYMENPSVRDAMIALNREVEKAQLEAQVAAERVIANQDAN